MSQNPTPSNGTASDETPNLGARFGMTAPQASPEADKPAEPAAAAGDPFERDRPVPPPARQPTLIPTAFWLPEALIGRLGTFCDQTGTTRREVLLRAVEAAVSALPELIEADARRRAEQTVPAKDVGGLFPRSSEASRPGRTAAEPSETITIRIQSDHRGTMDRIAADNGINRSTLARIALDSYLSANHDKK